MDDMRLLMVRHGRTASNVARLLDTAYPGADLDEVGRAQAESLVSRLEGENIDLIAVSDRVRTAQTAAPTAQARGLEPVVLPGLAEISAGEDELSPDWQRYVGTLQGWRDDPTLKIPGGETGHEFMERFEGALDELIGLGHDTVMVVSHGAALRAWSAARLPEFAEWLGPRGLPNTTVIVAEGSPALGWSLVSIDAPDDAI